MVATPQQQRSDTVYFDDDVTIRQFKAAVARQRTELLGPEDNVLFRRFLDRTTVAVPYMSDRRLAAMRNLVSGRYPSIAQAMMAAGYSENYARHRTGAFLRSTREQIARVLEAHGITPEFLADKLREGIESDDPRVRLRYLDMVFRIFGSYAPRQ